MNHHCSSPIKRYSGKNSTRLCVKPPKLGNPLRRFQVILVPLGVNSKDPCNPTTKGLGVPAPRNYQPFRQTPSSQGRGGGRSISLRGRTNSSRGYSKGKSIIIRFTTKKRSPESKPFHNRSLLVPNCAQSGGSRPTNCPKGHPLSSGKSRVGHINSKTIPSICKKITTFPQQLEIINTGSVYSTSGNRGCNTLPGDPIPGTYSRPSISQSTGEGIDPERNRNNVREIGDSGVLSPERGVYKLSISSHQKEWGEPTHNKPQESEFIYNLSTFQNGGVTPLEADPSKRGSNGKNRPERCLFLCTDAQKASPFLEIYVEGETLPVQLPPLWSRTSSTSVHQIVEASGSPVTQCLRLIVYLDNIILFNQTPDGILQDRDTTLWLLQQLGFVINWKKSV